jgi:uncharacterized SAM-binding protein YcdF (DUF218 family)
MQRRWTRGVVRGALLVLLLAGLWAAADLVYVSVGAETDYAAHADAIIVLGCNVAGSSEPTPCVQARAGHAADLFRQGYAPYVIASGGPTGGGPTEASVLARVLQDSGVPTEDIVLEDRALNTIQNINYTEAIMRDRGWNSAILVTEPFHIKRATLIARDTGLTVYPSPATDSSNWQNPLGKVYNLCRDALSLMLYQVKALVGVSE